MASSLGPWLATCTHPALVIPSARTILAPSGVGIKVKVVCAEGITYDIGKGKGVLKVPLGEEHQQEVHTPNMFFPDHLYLSKFLPAREGAKMVRAEGITYGVGQR
jgi:hypothetical protein